MQTIVITHMAVRKKQEHLVLSLMMVIAFLAATAFGSFALMGIVSSPTHRSEGQIELPYSRLEVWRALLDVESRNLLQPSWRLTRVMSRDSEGALRWEAHTDYGKISRHERVLTQSPSRIVFQEISDTRNSRLKTEFRLEVLRNRHTKVVATQYRETPLWFDRSLLLLYGINHNLKGTLNYLSTYYQKSAS